jgi:hypothetical protein
MGALLASEELGWRFVAAPRLNEPPEGRVMATLRTFDLRRRHCLDFLFFFANDFYFRIRLFWDVG